jgi:plastocyanin
MKQIKHKIPLIILVLLVFTSLLVGIMGCSSSPSPGSTTSPTSTSTTTTSAPSVGSGPSASSAGNTINLVAQNTAFNMKTITVPAGAKVTINFNNMDTGVPHNFAVYTDQSATTPIFKGEIISGPRTTTYTFNAPTSPGTYYFRCDVHPTVMNGQFNVQ